MTIRSKTKPILIAEFEPARRIDGESWTQVESGYTNCWYLEITEGKPSKVEENLVEYTEQGSLEDCQDNPSSWYWNEENGYLYIHTSGSDDPGVGDYIILIYFWFRYPSEKKDFLIGGKTYQLKPLLKDDSVPRIAMETAEYHEGGTKQTFESLKLINDGRFDTLLSTYIWERKRCIVRFGEEGQAYDEFMILWIGWTGGIWWSDEEIEFELLDLRECF